MRTLTKAAITAALSLAAVVAPATASAQYFLNFVGSVNLRNNPGSGGSQLLLNFVPGAVTVGTVTSVPTTNFPGIPLGATGVIQDLVVDNMGVVGSKAGDPTPVDPFLQISGYTFTLVDTPMPVDPTPANVADGFVFGPIQVNSAGPNRSSAVFAVRGFFTGGPFSDQRQYQGVFTAQFSSRSPSNIFNTINNGGQLNNVGFSAEFSAVPEPSTYALMGAGLLALGGVVRRRRTV